MRFLKNYLLFSLYLLLRENNFMSSKITIAMISMNEEKAVGLVIDNIKKIVPKAEILIVDSSSDKTAEVAEAKGARVIKQFPPKGYGMAMELALKSASGDVIVTMDCDGTYPSEEISKLIQLVNEGYDLVNTTRVLTKPKNMPFSNFIANRIFALLVRIVHGIKTTDVHSGMRAYKRELIHSLSWKPNGAAFPVELLVKAVNHGYKFVEIPINYHERIGTTTLRKFSSTIWTFKRIFYKEHYY